MHTAPERVIQTTWGEGGVRIRVASGQSISMLPFRSIRIRRVIFLKRRRKNVIGRRVAKGRESPFFKSTTLCHESSVVGGVSEVNAAWRCHPRKSILIFSSLLQMRAHRDACWLCRHDLHPIQFQVWVGTGFSSRAHFNVTSIRPFHSFHPSFLIFHSNLD